MSQTRAFKLNGEATTQNIDPKSACVGQYADYFDTGIWTLKDGLLFAPRDLTIEQLKDHLLACGGAVYLHKSDRLAWIPSDRIVATGQEIR
jgi:hypothetical protein